MTCYPSTINVFVGHRQIFHVYIFETRETLTFSDAEWFKLVITSLAGTHE
jgi:hypothetical protein